MTPTYFDNHIFTICHAGALLPRLNAHITTPTHVYRHALILLPRPYTPITLTDPRHAVHILQLRPYPPTTCHIYSSHAHTFPHPLTLYSCHVHLESHTHRTLQATHSHTFPPKPQPHPLPHLPTATVSESNFFFNLCQML